MSHPIHSQFQFIANSPNSRGSQSPNNDRSERVATERQLEIAIGGAFNEAGIVGGPLVFAVLLRVLCAGRVLPPKIFDHFSNFDSNPVRTKKLEFRS